MGEVVILHPQACLQNHSHSLAMKTIRFMDPLSEKPNLNVPGSRRRTPPKGILKKNDRNTDTVPSKNLVMGQVKILKRGEPLNEPSTVLKEVNHRKVSNNSASKQASQVPNGGRRVLPPKKKVENKAPKSRAEDLSELSSTRRLGPEPEIVSKHMTDCFAGSAFSDSPPPSSVPLPGFFRKKLVEDEALSDLRRILGLIPT